jgi:LDH2 family malate/lactate/ureidoglycolate dehydrogenase
MSDGAAAEPVTRVPIEAVERQLSAVLSAWGMEPDLVRTTVDAMAYCDRAGIDSHGISMLMMYEEGFRKGKLRVRARPRVVRETAVTALVDAGAGLGHPAAVHAMELAVAKALAAGVGVVSVFNSHHFGAAGYYAALAAAKGLVGLVTSSTRDFKVIPTRSAVPMLGTNPIAFAAPAGRNRPFVLDMSTSTAAANKVKVHDYHRRTLPRGWVVDERGDPVTDPALAMEYAWRSAAGGLTPLGGSPEGASHKGYGLSVMVQLLSSALSGGSFSPIRKRTGKEGDPDDVGHFFLALDPRAFRAEGAFQASVDAVVDELHAARPLDPALPVLVAGDPEEEARAERARTGVPIPRALAEKIRGVCERSGAPFLLGSPEV